MEQSSWKNTFLYENQLFKFVPLHAFIQETTENLTGFLIFYLIALSKNKI